MKAVDIMSTKIITIDNLATVAQAAQIMKQHNLRALIVERVSEEDAYGIITTTDISQAIAQAKNPATTYVGEVMTQPCIVVNPDLAVEHIARLFARGKIRIAPVIKEQLLGIISLTDLLEKTNYFTTLQANLTATTVEELAQLAEEELTINQGTIESDCLYENWCSG